MVVLVVIPQSWERSLLEALVHGSQNGSCACACVCLRACPSHPPSRVPTLITLHDGRWILGDNYPSSPFPAPHKSQRQSWAQDLP